MSTTYLPVIEEANFNSFKAIIRNDFPNEFQEWSKLYSDWKLAYPDFIEVPVKPKEFATYVEKNSLRPDKNSLLKFAEEEMSARPRTKSHTEVTNDDKAAKKP